MGGWEARRGDRQGKQTTTCRAAGQTGDTIPPEDQSAKRKRGVPDELSDDYIFNEINLYASRAHGLQADAEPVDTFGANLNITKPDPLSFKYNRRYQNNEMVNNVDVEVHGKSINNFKFNRMMKEIPK
uniref:Uncharacterized protein n=1 Tax=Caenorhabditis japonica TaxID=281687 RepID=A0A8R1EF64_CAEJA